MSADKTDLIAMTEDEINAMGTAQLRAAADLHLSEYARYRAVASIDITDDVLTTPGALTAVDNLVQVLSQAHRKHDPHVHKRYGDSIELRVRPTDDALRNSLKFERRQAIKAGEVVAALRRPQQEKKED